MLTTIHAAILALYTVHRKTRQSTLFVLSACAKS